PDGNEFSPQDEGDDATDSDANITTGQSDAIVLESGEENETIDAGVYELASLGDYVWEDTNGNGINDEPASAGIDGVTVNLLDEDGNVIATTTTMNGGFYEFTDLVPGTYSVQFELLDDYTFTTPGATGSDETNDSDADPANNGETEQVTLVSGQNYPDLDAGIQRVPEFELDKEFVSAVANADGTYDVTYTIDVVNTGGIGQYTLTDTPLFDQDVTINSGAFTGADAGALNVTGATTLVTDRMIAADATESYTLVFNVTLDLEPGSTDGGDNVFTECEGGSEEGVTGTPFTGLNNRADLDTDGDGTPDNSDDDCGDLPLFDLALSKDITSAGPYIQGSTVTYNVTVTNEGDIDASNVEVTDDAEVGLVFQSITPQAGVTSTGNGNFTVADLPVGTSVIVEMTFEVSATFQGTSLNNAAEITEDGPFDDVDSDPTRGPETDEDGDGSGDDDDEDNVDIPVEQVYDLELSKAVTSAGPYQQGSTVEYTLTITNDGSLNAAGIEVTDTPQEGLTFVSSDADGVAVTEVSPTVYTIAALAQGETQTIVLTYTIDATFQGTSLNNAAEITEDDGDDVDSDPTTGPETDEDGDGSGDDDDEDNVDIPVEQIYDLELSKAVTSAGPYQQGSTVEYTLTITNDGSLDAANIAVMDTPQEGLTFVSSDADGVAVTEVSPTVYTIAALAQGETQTIVLTYTIDATFQGTSLNNAAEITEDDGDDVDSDPTTGPETDEDGDGNGDDDDEDNVDIPVEQVYDLELSKAVTSAGPYQQGSTVEYTLTITNDGSLNAAGIEVTDTPQEGLTFVSSDADGVAVTEVSPTVYTIAALAQGETQTIVLTYTIDATFQGTSLNNAAEITEDDGDDVDSDPTTGPETDEDGDGSGDDDDEDNVDIPVE
ncbi:SdrD B-like domain-containing protein, partial [Neolewinella agarilytica]